MHSDEIRGVLLLTKCFAGDLNKKFEMGCACGTTVQQGSLKEKLVTTVDRSECDIRMGFKDIDWKEWTGFVWLWIWTGSGLL